MSDHQIDCLIGPQKANIVRRFLPAFRNTQGLRRSPDLEGFFNLALRRAKADGYSIADLLRFADGGHPDHSDISRPTN